VTWFHKSWKKGRRMSFRARLGTFIALAVGLTVAVAAGASYFVVRHQLYSQMDSSLRSALPPQAQIDPQRFGAILQQTQGGFLQEIASDGGYLYNSLQYQPGFPGYLRPTTAQKAIASDQNGGSRIDTVTYNGQRYRVLTETAVVNNSLAAIQIGEPLSVLDHTLAELRVILWFVTLGGVIIGIGLGYLIGRETIRPVTRLTGAAEYVAATQDLRSTIEVESEDELGRLARSFNSMLMALAASRRQQAQLISDAGHELRTPLTSLRTNIEVLMRRPDLPEQDRTELFTDVEAQLAELTNLIGDLVDLAREEERQPEPIEVRLDSLVAAAVERVRRRAPGVTFETHLTAGSVRAQPALLERAIVNVLDNAVKWSPPGGSVDIWLQRGAIWTLDVHDHGPGIAPEDLPHVFDRFYRADTARSMPGSGLGLAIVQQVVRNHGGAVFASSPSEGGTVIHIELPIVSEVEADADQPQIGAASEDSGIQAIGPAAAGDLTPPEAADAPPEAAGPEAARPEAAGSPPEAAGPEVAGAQPEAAADQVRDPAWSGTHGPRRG
jgi:two-component system, OmpR family, sensor histidine kinase MprB